MNKSIERNLSAPVRRYRLDDRDVYAIDGVECRLVDSDEHRHVFKERNGDHAFKAFSHEDFAVLLDDGTVVIHRHRDAVAHAALRSRKRDVDLRDLPAKEQDRVLFYQGLCKYFDVKAVEREQGREGRKVNLGKACLEWLLPEAHEHLVAAYDRAKRAGKPQRFRLGLPSARQFARLYRNYQACGGSAAAFAHRYRGTSSRAKRGSPDELRIRKEHQLGFACPSRPSMAHQYRAYCDAIRLDNRKRREDELPPLKAASRKTFEKGITELDQFWMTLQREGEKAALSKYGPSGEGFDYIHPLERVEMDEWKLDLFTILQDLGVWETMTAEEREAVKRARLWATVAIDVATRCVLALKLHHRAPGADTALETLELALTDKSAIADYIGAGCSWEYNGWIETIVTDNGSAFTSREFEIAAQDLKIELLHTRAGDPKARAHIERLFKTFSQQFLNEYSGRTFASVTEKGNYDPQAEATLCADVVAHGILRQAIDIYHNTPHEGLCGETPRHAWLRMTRDHPVEVPPDRDLLRKTFGLELERKVTKEGIRFMGLQFNSERLQRALHGKEVLLRVARLDVSTISVWNGREWFDIRSVIAPPDDMSIYEWAVIGARHMATHAGNHELAIDVAVDAANEVRKDARIAELRAGFNPLRSRGSDRAWLDALDRERFASLRVVEGRKETAPLVNLTGPRCDPAKRYERPALWDEGSEPPDEDRYRVRPEDEVVEVDGHEDDRADCPGQLGGEDDIEFE